MGECIGKRMSTITFEHATYRVHFKKLNPTHCHKDKEKDFDANYKKTEMILILLFLCQASSKNDIYQKYLTDPLGEGMFEKAQTRFGSSPIASFYHFPKSSEAYNKVSKKYPLEGPICPPFLPGVASNRIDVGRKFDRGSRFDLDSVKAAIYLSSSLYIYNVSIFKPTKLGFHQKQNKNKLFKLLLALPQ